jgi:hypothetical protein
MKYKTNKRLKSKNDNKIERLKKRATLIFTNEIKLNITPIMQSKLVTVKKS